MEPTMKKLFGTLLLVTCLSMPTFAGHNQAGGCACGTPGCVEDYPGECSGNVRTATTESTPTDNSSDLTSELGIALVAILVWMRMRA
jgi:hypothetical protein